MFNTINDDPEPLTATLYYPLLWTLEPAQTFFTHSPSCFYDGNVGGSIYDDHPAQKYSPEKLKMGSNGYASDV